MIERRTFSFRAPIERNAELRKLDGLFEKAHTDACACGRVDAVCTDGLTKLDAMQILTRVMCRAGA